MVKMMKKYWFMIFLVLVGLFVGTMASHDNKVMKERYGDAGPPTYTSHAFVDTDGQCYKIWKSRHHGAWSGVTKEECPK